MKKLALLPVFLAFLVIGVCGQNKCFTKEESQRVIETIKNPGIAVSENKELRRELLKMVEAYDKLNQKITDDFDKNKKLVPEFNKLGETNLLRLCQIFKERGWLTKDLVKEDGVAAMLSIIQNNRVFQLQTEFYPILIEASNKGLIPKGDVAAMVDSIRTSVGQPQIFGTQAKIRNDVIYLNPLLNEEKVDEWRKQYDLPPLDVFIRQLEIRYLMNVLKSPPMTMPPNLQTKVSGQKDETALLGIADDENEVLTIDTKLVNLNVRILNQDFTLPVDLQLSKDDFAVLEDGHEQEVSFFSATDAPFDLVLVLDFSGSTVKKRDLIKEAAQRFIQVTRPSDRVAVIVFTEEIEVVSNLTTDKQSLAEKIKKVDLTGGSRIWGSVKFTYDNIIKKESPGRRNAIILMTDGIDSNRDLTFADLYETVRKNETTIFPVYLENEDGDNGTRYHAKARQALWMLAEESGGSAYHAKKTKDLRGIYEQIVNDLGKVYSVGYEPKNENRDGGWRNLTVKIKTRPDLIARTRRGYYAK
jgi:VWFA-related protein